MRLKILSIIIDLFIRLNPFKSFGVEWRCVEGNCDNGQGGGELTFELQAKSNFVQIQVCPLISLELSNGKPL